MRAGLVAYRGVALVFALARSLAAQEAPVAESGNAAAEAREHEPSSSLELSAALGPSLVFGEPANPAFSESVGRVGVELAGPLAIPPATSSIRGWRWATLGSLTAARSCRAGPGEMVER